MPKVHFVTACPTSVPPKAALVVHLTFYVGQLMLVWLLDPASN